MTEHKLCADLRLRNGYGLLALVEDEAGAVREGLKRDARSFRICEVDVATPEDKVEWVFSPTTDYSGARYLGVDKIYGVDEVIAEAEKSAASLKASGDPSDRGRGEALAFVAGLYGKYRESFNNVAYIREPSPYARPWDFHPLRHDEKVFDSSGTQVWPKPATPAP